MRLLSSLATLGLAATLAACVDTSPEIMAPDAGPSNLVSLTDTDGDIEIKKPKIDVTKWG